MANTSKRDLITETAASTGLSQNKVRVVVEEFFKAIRSSLREEQRIELRGFGSFENQERKARVARNPRTGDVVPVAPSKTAHFKFSPELIQKINQTQAADTQVRVHEKSVQK